MCAAICRVHTLDIYSIHRTYGDVHQSKISDSMNLRFQMVDTDTGEILGKSYKIYALNFADKNDVGFRRCLEWCMSCVRGIRSTNHKNIELKIFFGEEKVPLSLFEQDEIINNAKCVLTSVL